MKKLIIFISAVAVISSCKKDLNDVTPTEKQHLLNAIQQDSIPDSACIKVQILKDSTMIDETAVAFFHFATSTYNSQLDARQFAGFGIASLATLTADGIPCASQCIPFKPVNVIGLKIGSKANDSYLLKLSYLHSFPAGTHIWLKDRLSGDSIDLRRKNYTFSVNKSDTSTFGSQRFKVILQ